MAGSGRVVVEGGLGDRASLRGTRRRVLDGPPLPEQVAHWPDGWRRQLRGWLRSAAQSRRIDALFRGLDAPALAEGRELLEALLQSGWIFLEERHERGGVWSPRQLTWRDADGLRQALGLERLDMRDAMRTDIAARRFSQPEAEAAHAALLELPEALWTRRIDLVEAVERWAAEARHGSHRDFELLARGATKSLSGPEWEWLREVLDLAALGISGHAPGLWLRGRFRLALPEGILDLGITSEPLALTPATLLAATGISPRPRVWRVVENRTSFERAARAAAADTAVLWVPGRPPIWWRDAVSHLLDLAPAPAFVACDPDPAGIAIASEVGALWQSHGEDWQPQGMDPDTLAALPALQPLSDWDRKLLDTLAQRPLHATLEALRIDLAERGMKGEQEGWL
ncbi:hypothetical protein [Pseudomarimonas salicorniae]|uniref:DUF2399 domain-containing protein n=1 Tax=Pseudomarimonas salicorniae TaxID=2933270 RepID=A0ABT0GGZ8_9GAMM|nr:hypothetical protein [Lysobacter sp. CAU 1642]MCK7593627.1 hypothetical protein [Lysobacter sp. CAU 1642]